MRPEISTVVAMKNLSLGQRHLHEIKLKLKAAGSTETILRYDTSQKTDRLYLPVRLIITALPYKR
jgi:hypothetical protein